MNEMLNYIFCNMKASEKGIKVINRTLRSQRRFNAGMIFTVVGMTVCISAVKNHIDEQNAKIKKLEKRIDELCSIEENDSDNARGE